MQDFMIKPVQRLCKYPLLLKVSFPLQELLEFFFMKFCPKFGVFSAAPYCFFEPEFLFPGSVLVLLFFCAPIETSQRDPLLEFG